MSAAARRMMVAQPSGLCGSDRRDGCPTGAGSRAFTLIEILIVIGIISVLISIVLAVGSALGQSTEIKQTRSTMLILQGALDEWETSADRQLSWGINGVPGVADGFPRDAVYDMQVEEPPGSPRKHVYLLTEMLGTIGSSTAIRDLLVQIDDDRFPIYNSANTMAPAWIRNLPDNEPDPDAGDWEAEWQSRRWDGEPAVLDAWEHPIRFVHAGRLWSTDPWFDDFSNGVARNADGTILTFYELVYGVAQNRQGYFISAGPDGEFGSLDPNDPRQPDIFEATRDNVYSSEVIKP